MNFDGYTQFGLAGILIGIVFFIIRYMVSAIKSKDEKLIQLTNKFMKIAQDSTDSRKSLKKAIEMNTKASQEAMRASQQTSDNMTKLVVSMMKEK